MTQQIFQFEVNGGAEEQPRFALGFDTGLDARSFAQAKTARYMTEPGLIVLPGGTIETWQANGVIESEGGSMVVWGPPFTGSRLDLLLAEPEQQDAAMEAIINWIQARLILASRADITVPAPSWPYAAIIAGAGSNYPAGTCFFAPENLARRCFQSAAGAGYVTGGEWYTHPEYGSEAALVSPEVTAFGAAAMLYRILAGTPPFPALDETVLHEDMREGNVLPLCLAAPGITPHLAELVDAALHIPKPAAQTAPPCPEAILTIIRPEGSAASTVASLFSPLDADSRAALEAEKERRLKRNAAAVSARRFIKRNTAAILGGIAALVVVALAAFSVVYNNTARPTTAGLSPIEVIERYYHSFGVLDHQTMESCVTGGAGKNDINMVASFFVINRVRQAYESNAPPLIIPAEDWLASGGGSVEAEVFGVTDLHLELVSSGEAAARYRADYRFWIPSQENPEPGGVAPPLQKTPQAVRRTEEITLTRTKGNWRISEMKTMINQ